MTLTEKTKRIFFKWREPLLCFAIFALTLPLVYWFSRINFDPHHTGLMLKGALDVANGKRLFAETYTQYGALVTWIQALFIRMLGTSVTSILLATSLFYALSYPLLYRMARRFLSIPVSLLTTLVSVFLAPFYFWEFQPWSSVFALFFLLCSLLALFHVFERERPAVRMLCALLSGLGAILTFWCRQPAGIVAVVAGWLVFGIPALLLRKEKPLRNEHLRHLALFTGGVAIGFVLLLIPILATDAWDDFIMQSIKGMFTFASDRSHVETNGIIGAFGILLANLFLNPILSTWDLPVINIMWTLLPLAVVGLALLTVLRMRRAVKEGAPEAVKDHMLLLAYTLFAGCAWHQYYPIGCYRHWYWGSFLCVPAVLLILRLTVQWLAGRKGFKWLLPQRNRVIAFWLAVALVLAPNVGVRMVRGAAKSASTKDMVLMQNEHYDYLNGIYLDANIAHHYNTLFDAVHELQAAFPEKNVINQTENGIYAVFGENFHPMFNNTEDFFYEDYPEVRDAYIKAERPIVIGPKAPLDDYVLYQESQGDPGDPTAQYHRLPPNIYLPVELAVQLTLLNEGA